MPEKVREQQKSSEILLAGNAMKKSLKSGFGTFKKLADDIAPLLESGNIPGAMDILSQMNESILEIQRGVNRQLELMDIPETHIATRIASIVASEREEEEPVNTKNYYNMAFITVVGKVVESPRKFATKNGTEMFSFKVVETECYSDREYKTVFEVTYRQDDFLFGKIVKDAGVTVTGSFSCFPKKFDDRTVYVLKVTASQITLHS